MNEEDLLNLKLAGYKYDRGVIIDAEGNYIKNVDLKGNSYSSELSEEDYALNLASRKRAREEELQIEQAKNQQRQDLLDYSKHPLLFNTPEISDKYKNTEATSTKKNETLQITNTLTVSNDEKSTLKIMYKYPIVLVASIFIFLLIKKLIK